MCVCVTDSKCVCVSDCVCVCVCVLVHLHVSAYYTIINFEDAAIVLCQGERGARCMFKGWACTPMCVCMSVCECECVSLLLFETMFLFIPYFTVHCKTNFPVNVLGQ